MDFNSIDMESDTLNFALHASLNPDLGLGAVFEQSWLFAQWPQGFVNQYRSSIEFLELYALAILTWNDYYRLRNNRVQVFCDNESVVHMIKNNFILMWTVYEIAQNPHFR